MSIINHPKSIQTLLGNGVEIERKSESCVHQKVIQTRINTGCDRLHNVIRDTPTVTCVTPELLPDRPVRTPTTNVPAAFIPKTEGLTAYDLFIGFDTEYEEWREEGVDGKLRRNRILCYQYLAVWRDTDNDTYKLVEDIVYIDGGEDMPNRQTQGEILTAILRQFGIGYRRAKRMNVLWVSHFGVAEWAALRDRHELANEHLAAIRGVPVSFRGFPIRLKFGHRNYADVEVTWRDTFLLSPQGNQSLRAISKVTTHKKRELEDDEMEHMGTLLQTDQSRFEDYAVHDPRVTLEYFFQFMKEYNDLFNMGECPLTLGDGAVKAYLQFLERHPVLSYDKVFGYEEKAIINGRGWNTTRKDEVASRKFTKVMASEAYMGGLNAAYELGEYHATPDEIILDIDLAGAYTSALSTLPVIDWRVQGSSINVTDILTSYQSASSRYANMAACVPMAFIHCEFSFPDTVRNVFLPVPTKFGLVYPQQGTTTCTGPEVALAIEMGANVRILRSDLMTNLRVDGRPVLAFAEFLGALARQRAVEASGTLRNLLLKETANSFYGKLAQAIDDRSVYNLSGKKERLKASRITTPHYAAMTTGMVRAALCSIIHAVNRQPGCRVLSATTDGCMIVVPRTFDVVVSTKKGEEGNVIPPSVKDAIPDLYREMCRYYAIQGLEQGRINMGLEGNTWLEVKHVGDTALTWKTRGYVLTYRGVEQHLAHSGFQVSKKQGASEVYDLYYNVGIQSKALTRLTTLRAIHERDAADLVQVVETREVNVDPDYKNIPLPDGSGRTRAPETVEEVFKARQTAKNLRRSGHRADPSVVALALNTPLRIVGGFEPTVRRQIYRAVAKNMGQWGVRGMAVQEVAVRLGISEATFRQHRYREFYPNSLPDTPEVRRIIDDVAEKLGKRVTNPMLRVLLQSVNP